MINHSGEFSTKRVRVTPTWMDATLASAPRVGVLAPEGEYFNQCKECGEMHQRVNILTNLKKWWRNYLPVHQEWWCLHQKVKI